MTEKRDTRYFFRKKLKELRKAKGWNQTVLAQMLGTKQSTISGYESGYSYPERDVLQQIIDLFNITYEELHYEDPHTASQKDQPSTRPKENRDVNVFDLIESLEEKYPQEQLLQQLKSEFLRLQLQKNKSDEKLLSLYELLEKQLGFKFDD